MDEQRNVSINPLNNGNLLWAPELVLTLTSVVVVSIA